MCIKELLLVSIITTKLTLGMDERRPLYDDYTDLPELKPGQALRKAAGFVIYRKPCDSTIEYLLIQSSFGNHIWTPPKGGLEVNELEMHAAIRETEEEAGIQADSINVRDNFKKVITYEPKNQFCVKHVTYWLAYLTNPDTPVILSHEHQDYKWLSLEEAKEKVAFPEMQKLFDDCENYITKVSLES